MFKGDQTPKPGVFDSIIGKTVEIEGTVKSSGSIRIEGRMKGTLISEGDVLIGEGALVEANVSAGAVTVSGTLHGNVSCKGRLELLPTARLYGDVSVGTLVISEGAVFVGKTEMSERGKEAPSTKNVQKQA